MPLLQIIVIRYSFTHPPIHPSVCPSICPSSYLFQKHQFKCLGSLLGNDYITIKFSSSRCVRLVTSNHFFKEASSLTTPKSADLIYTWTSITCVPATLTFSSILKCCKLLYDSASFHMCFHFQVCPYLFLPLMAYLKSRLYVTSKNPAHT